MNFNIEIEDESSSDYSYPISTLCLTNAFLTNKRQSLFKRIKPLFDLIQIDSLVINGGDLCPSIFIKLLNSLSHLQYLRISDYSLFHREHRTRQDQNMLKKFLKNNKINKIVLSTPGDFVKALDILHMFPRTQYFAILNISTFQIRIFLQCVLPEIRGKKINRPLTICFFAIDLDDSLLNDLEFIIFMHENGKIYRQNDRLYLQWK